VKKIEFSVSDGGALLNALRRIGILGRNQPSLSRRILWMILLTWFPLLILTAFRGEAFPGKVQIPFVYDLIQHARFLIALPIALWAESYVSPKLKSVLQRFFDAKLVPEDDIPRFEKAISFARSLKDAVVIELLLLALSYLYMSLGLQRTLMPGLSSWYQSALGILEPKSPAEHWYRWVSLPIFIFIWLRWIWRQLVWSYLLFSLSRLKLRLKATHPDHAGGLAFISVGQRRFSVLVFAISTIASASIAEEIIFGGARLQSFESELTAFFIVCILIVMGPLIVFSPLMIRSKLRDWSKYGVLAAQYTYGFDEKWIQGNCPAGETLLGSPDIQSLADMKNSYEGISQMRTILPDRNSIIILLIAYVLPLIPLLTTIIPLREILSHLFKLLAK